MTQACAVRCVQTECVGGAGYCWQGTGRITRRAPPVTAAASPYRGGEGRGIAWELATNARRAVRDGAGVRETRACRCRELRGPRGDLI